MHFLRLMGCWGKGTGHLPNTSLCQQSPTSRIKLFKGKDRIYALKSCWLHPVYCHLHSLYMLVQLRCFWGKCEEKMKKWLACCWMKKGEVWLYQKGIARLFVSLEEKKKKGLVQLVWQQRHLYIRTLNWRGFTVKPCNYSKSAQQTILHDVQKLSSFGEKEKQTDTGGQM